METKKRLYRSKTNKVLGGVCGGVAEYLDADPTLVRIVWIVLTLMGGSGVLLYIIAYLIMPDNPEQKVQESFESNSNMRFIVGILLILLGLLLLFDTLDLFSFHDLWAKSWEYLLPVILIVLGVALMLRRKKMSLTSSQFSDDNSSASSGEVAGQETGTENFQERLMRSTTDKKLLGICGGIGEYFHIDSTIVRLLYILFTFATGGVGVILYFLLALVLPKNPIANKQVQ